MIICQLIAYITCVIVLMSIGMFLIGIGLVSGPGYFVFQMFDDFSVALPLLFIGFFQTIAVSWVYGNDK